MKRFDASIWKCSCNVADSKFDQSPVRVFLLVGSDPFGDVGEQVGSLQFEVILVDFYHVEPCCPNRVYFKWGVESARHYTGCDR